MISKIPFNYETEAQRAHILKLLAPAILKVSKPYERKKGWKIFVTISLPDD